MGAVHALRAAGHQHIALEVVTENSRALALYHSCGFRETNEYGYYYLAL
jgi:ribosomal protein S18 acetylase RimI-like enzyme